MTLAVLFDFNGVLVDDEDVHFEAFRRVLAAFDLTIEHHVYRRFLGFDDRNTIIALLSHYGRRAALGDERLSRVVVEKQNVYAQLAGQQPRLGFGARALVRALREAGARLAIVSGARRAEIDAVLDAAALRSTFDVVIAAEDVTRGKPDPEGYGLARARLEAAAGGPLDAVAIEDAPAGLRAARGAGLRCVGPRDHLSRQRARRRGRDRRLAGRAGSAAARGGSPPRPASPGGRATPILFTPGPVRVPPADHARARRSAVQLPPPGRVPRAARAIERDLIALLGIRIPRAIARPS